MKKKTMTKARLQWSFSLLFLILNLSLFSQDKLNIEKVGQLSYDRGLNDVWGYTDAAGAEYALVGLDSGVSIVDISPVIGMHAGNGAIAISLLFNN